MQLLLISVAPSSLTSEIHAHQPALLAVKLAYEPLSSMVYIKCSRILVEELKAEMCVIGFARRGGKMIEE